MKRLKNSRYLHVRLIVIGDYIGFPQQRVREIEGFTIFPIPIARLTHEFLKRLPEPLLVGPGRSF